MKVMYELDITPQRAENLRKLVDATKLSHESIFGWLLDNADAISMRFAKMPVTPPENGRYVVFYDSPSDGCWVSHMPVSTIEKAVKVAESRARQDEEGGLFDIADIVASVNVKLEVKYEADSKVEILTKLVEKKELG